MMTTYEREQTSSRNIATQKIYSACFTSHFDIHSMYIVCYKTYARFLFRGVTACFRTVERALPT